MVSIGTRLDLVHSFGECKELLVRLGQQFLIVGLLGQLEGDLGLLELGEGLLQRLGLGLELLIFVDDLLCRGLVVPEVSFVHLLLELGATGELVVVVKESRGWL